MYTNGVDEEKRESGAIMFNMIEDSYNYISL